MARRAHTRGNPWRVVDVHVTGRLGFYHFALQTAAAIAWWAEHVGTDHTCCDDTGYAQDIAAGMQADGLCVR